MAEWKEGAKPVQGAPSGSTFIRQTDEEGRIIRATPSGAPLDTANVVTPQEAKQQTRIGDYYYDRSGNLGVVPNSPTDIFNKWKITSDTSLYAKPTKDTGSILEAMATPILGTAGGAVGAGIGAAAKGAAGALAGSAGGLLGFLAIGGVLSAQQAGAKEKEYKDALAEWQKSQERAVWDVAGNLTTDENGRIFFTPDPSKAITMNTAFAGSEIQKAFNKDTNVYFGDDGRLKVEVNPIFAATDQYNEMVDLIKRGYSGLTKDTENADQYIAEIKDYISNANNQFKFREQSIYSYKAQIPDAPDSVIEDAYTNEIGAYMSEKDGGDYEVKVYRDGEIETTTAKEVLENVYNKDLGERSDYMLDLFAKMEDPNLSPEDKTYVLSEIKMLYAADDNDNSYDNGAKNEQGESVKTMNKYHGMLDQESIISVLNNWSVIGGVNVISVINALDAITPWNMHISDQRGLQEDPAAASAARLISTATSALASYFAMQGIEHGIIRPVAGKIGEAVTSGVGSFLERLAARGGKLSEFVGEMQLAGAAAREGFAVGGNAFSQWFQGARLAAGPMMSTLGFTLSELLYNATSDLLFDAGKQGIKALAGEEPTSEEFLEEFGVDLVMDLVMQYGPAGLAQARTALDNYRLEAAYAPYRAGVEYAQQQFDAAELEYDALKREVADMRKGTEQYKEKAAELQAKEKEYNTAKSNYEKLRAEAETAVEEVMPSASEEIGAALAGKIAKAEQNNIVMWLRKKFTDEKAGLSVVAEQAYNKTRDVYLYAAAINKFQSIQAGIKEVGVKMKMDIYAKGTGKAYTDFANAVAAVVPNAKFSKTQIQYLVAKAEYDAWTRMANGDSEMLAKIEEKYLPYINKVEGEDANRLNNILETMREYLKKVGESYVKSGAATNQQVKDIEAAALGTGYIPLWGKGAKTQKFGIFETPLTLRVGRSFDESEGLYDVEGIENPVKSALAYTHNVINNIARNEMAAMLQEISSIDGLGVELVGGGAKGAAPEFQDIIDEAIQKVAKSKENMLKTEITQDKYASGLEKLLSSGDNDAAIKGLDKLMLEQKKLQRLVELNNVETKGVITRRDLAKRFPYDVITYKKDQLFRGETGKVGDTRDYTPIKEYAETYSGEVVNPDKDMTVLRLGNPDVNNYLGRAINEYRVSSGWRPTNAAELRKVQQFEQLPTDGASLSQLFNAQEIPAIVKEALNSLGIDGVEIPGKMFPSYAKGPQGLLIGHQTEVVSFNWPNKKIDAINSRATKIANLDAKIKEQKQLQKLVASSNNIKQQNQARTPDYSIKPKKGYGILYTNTPNNNVDIINKEGLKVGQNLKAYGSSPDEGMYIWTDSRNPKTSDYGGNTVAFQVPLEEIKRGTVNNTQVIIPHDIPREDILFIDKIYNYDPVIKSSNLEDYVNKYGAEKTLEVLGRNTWVNIEEVRNMINKNKSLETSAKLLQKITNLDAKIKEQKAQVRADIDKKVRVAGNYFNKTYKPYGITVDIDDYLSSAKYTKMIDGKLNSLSTENLIRLKDDIARTINEIAPYLSLKKVDTKVVNKQVAAVKAHTRARLNKEHPDYSVKKKNTIVNQTAKNFRAQLSGDYGMMYDDGEDIDVAGAYKIPFTSNNQDASFYIKGKLAKEVAAEMTTKNIADRRAISEFFKEAANIKRLLTTGIDPTRVLPNLVRDTIRNGIMSGGTDYWFFDNSPFGFTQMFTKMARAMGDTDEQIANALNTLKASQEVVSGSTYNEALHGRRTNVGKRLVESSNAVGDNRGVKFVWELAHDKKALLEAPMNWAESLTRNRAASSAFMRAYLRGGEGLSYETRLNNAYEAGLNAGRENTVNFMRRGTFINEIASYVPYLSQRFASVESTKIAFLKDPIGVSSRLMMFGMAYMLELSRTLADERSRKSYYNLSEYDRENNIILSIGNGNLVTIPLDETIASLIYPWRRGLESLHNVDPEEFYKIMVSGFLELSPFDLSGFTEGDSFNFGRGVEKLGAQMLPTLAQFAYTQATGRNMYYGSSVEVTADSLAEYGNYNPAPGDFTTAGKNSQLLRTISNALGIEQWRLQQGLADLGGNVGQYVLNWLDKISGAPEDAQGGKEFVDATFKSFTGMDSQQVQYAFNDGINQLTEEKGKLRSKLVSLNQQISLASGTRLAELQEEYRKVKQDFAMKVGNFVDKYINAYEIAGGLDKSQANRIWYLLNFADDDTIAMAGSVESYYRDLAKKQANNEATKYSANILDKYYDQTKNVYKDSSGKWHYYSPYGEQSFFNTVQGRGMEYQIGLRNLVESDLSDLSTERSKAYDDREAAYQAGNWDEYDKIGLRFDDKVIETIAPYVKRYGASNVLTNSSVLDYLEEWFFVPSSYMKSKYGKNVSLAHNASKQRAFVRPYIKELFGLGTRTESNYISRPENLVRGGE